MDSPRKGGRGRKAPKAVTKEQVKAIVGIGRVMKYVDAGSGGFNAIDVGGSVFFLNQIAQSTGSTTPLQRNGYKVRNKSLELRYTVASGIGMSPDAWNCLRVVVVQFFRPAGISYTINDILDSGFVSTASAPYSPFNYFNSKESANNFRILLDKIHGVGPGGPAALSYTLTIPLKGMSVFDGPDGDPTQCLENGLWLAVVSDSAAATHPSFAFVSRITWHDESN